MRRRLASRTRTELIVDESEDARGIDVEGKRALLQALLHDVVAGTAPDTSRTSTKTQRILALKPEIDALRVHGRSLAEIAGILGVNRDTLRYAMTAKRGKKKAGGSKPKRKRIRGVAEAEPRQESNAEPPAELPQQEMRSGDPSEHAATRRAGWKA